MDPAAQRRLAAGLKLYPRHIHDEVLEVLRRAARGKGPSPQYLTAYQILARIQPDSVRRNLEMHYGASGRRAHHYYGAASCIATACVTMWKQDRRKPTSAPRRVEIAYLDTRGLQIGTALTVPGYSVCGLYRLGH